MAAWITIYATSAKPIPDASALKKALESDWWTLGEDVGLDEDAVNAFMKKLTWKADSVGEKAKRGLVLHVWTEPKRVKTELEELGKVPKGVKPRLAGVRTVVAIEYGLSQVDTMLEVVAFEIAYRLAETHDGVIKADNGAWFDHDAHRWNPYK